MVCLYCIHHFVDLRAIQDAKVEDVDYEGVLPSIPENQFDYYLLFSWLVILVALAHLYKLSSAYINGFYHRLWNLFHNDHPHLD